MTSFGGFWEKLLPTSFSQKPEPKKNSEKPEILGLTRLEAKIFFGFGLLGEAGGEEFLPEAIPEAQKKSPIVYQEMVLERDISPHPGRLLPPTTRVFFLS